MARKTQLVCPDRASSSRDSVSIPDAHFVKKSRAARQWRALSRGEEAVLGSFDVGPYRVDLDSRVIRTVERDISLTPMEYCLLKHLAANHNEPIPHRELANKLWGAYSGKGVHSLRCFIRNLRKKLETDPAHPQYIITVPGVGYCLAIS
jgi:two-component system, OmpR family, KDP operon response regulator KdpE